MIGLGAYHGINPGMGWLFAVALGMQAGRASAMWRALPPIALGHAISVGVVVALFAGAGVVLPLQLVKVVIAATLVTLGIYRLWRHRHPRFGGGRAHIGSEYRWRWQRPDFVSRFGLSRGLATCRKGASRARSR